MQNRHMKFDRMGGMDVGQITKATSFPKKLSPLLEKAVRLFKVMDNMEGRGRGMLIGGVPLRLYTNKEYGGRTAVNCHTDIDLAFREIPAGIKAHLKEEGLVVKVKEKLMGTMGPKASGKPVRKEERSEYTVFHLREEMESEFPVFHDVCFFEGSVGKISVRGEDISTSKKLVVSDQSISDKILELRVADLGFLLATIVNDQAITETRARRAVYAIASNAGDVAESASRYSQVMNREGIGKGELSRAFGILNRIATKAVSEPVAEFIAKAKESITGK
jgi:hypothetical protein